MQVLPVKFSVLNQLPVVIVGTLAPDVSDKFGALVDEPPTVLPKVNVLVKLIIAVNPPVPVQVNPVAVDISRFINPDVAAANSILPTPNDILRVLVLDELNVPVVSVNPAKFSVPDVKVEVLIPPEKIPLSVVVPE